MNSGKLRIVGCVAGLAGLLFSGSAFAQTADAAPAAPTPASPPEPAPAPAPEPAPAAASDTSASGSAQVGMALPGAAPQAAAVAGTSDHDSVVGRLAFGYLGRNAILAGSAVAGATTIDTPVIGIRYWFSDMVGLDAGVGFGFTSGSVTNAMGTSTDNPGWRAFMLHGGVPLSLASAGHFSFQIVPELNVGMASSSGDMDVGANAFHFDIGARAGAEIHFGFIDVPQLSLQGSIGVRANIDSTSTDPGDGGTSNFSWATTVGDNPWNIFTSNVAALYYF